MDAETFRHDARRLRGHRAGRIGLEQTYRDDIRCRSAGDVESNDPSVALGRPMTVSIPAGRPWATVFDRNEVVVRAFHVDHGHVKPALGYRVEYNGRSVVFSGDTVASPLVAKAARDCDLLDGQHFAL